MRSHFEVGAGYEGLQMLTDARRSYEQAIPGDNDYLACQFRLMHLGAPTSGCAREAERGLRLLKEHATCGQLISYTAWCLHHSGNSEKAYDLIIRNWRRIRWTETEFYLVSRYASKVNTWEIAAATLSTALTASREYHASAFLDSDIELLLRHAAMGDLSERVALAFGDPRFHQAVEQGSGEIPLDYLMLSRVPVEFRSHLKLDCASALFWLHPMAPASVRDGYLKWQRSEVRRNCFYADRAIARSAQFILDHQLEWAIAAARDGNFLGARCHCMFALARRPGDLPAFEGHLRPLGLDYFLNDARHVLLVDPQFFAKCEAIVHVTDERASRKPGDLLDDLGDSCSESAVFRLRLAWLEMRQGRHESAARRFIEIARQWPLDPAAFNNGIVSLMALGKWDAAQRLFKQRRRVFGALSISISSKADSRPAILPPESDWSGNRFMVSPTSGGLLTPRKPQIEQNIPTL